MFIPVMEIVAEVEPALNKVPQQTADNVRIKVTNLHRRTRPPPSNTSKEERSAIRSLRRDESVIILPANKGNASVLLNRGEYDDKMTVMLECKQMYKELKKDPAPALQRSINAKLLSLKKKVPFQIVCVNSLEVNQEIHHVCAVSRKYTCQQYHLDQ